MSANERIPDAMSDFDAAVRSGIDVDEAIAVAAKENDLKEQVVRVRAEKAFGDLADYQANCLRIIELHQEKLAKLQPLAEHIDAVYARGSQLAFIPIGHFIREKFSVGFARDEAFAFARDYQKKRQQN